MTTRRRLAFSFNSIKGGHTVSVRFARLPGRDDLDLTQVSLGVGGIRHISHARLSKSDRGRYDFWAGARIAFDRLLRAWPHFRSYRRIIQLHLAVAQNQDRLSVLWEAAERTSATLDHLVAEIEAESENEAISRGRRGHPTVEPLEPRRPPALAASTFLSPAANLSGANRLSAAKGKAD
jgi:hypothetical protein